MNDINNTELGFIAGVDSVYTLKLSLSNMDALYPEIYLVDLKNDSIIRITTEETEYVFESKSTDTVVKRFKIRTSLFTSLPTVNSTINTSKIFSADKKIIVNNVNGESGNLLLYNSSGKNIQNIQIEANTSKTIETKLTTGVYIAKLKTKTEELTERIIIR